MRSAARLAADEARLSRTHRTDEAPGARAGRFPAARQRSSSKPTRPTAANGRPRASARGLQLTALRSLAHGCLHGGGPAKNWWTSVWLLPAVPEAGVVFDLVEGRVEVAKLVADPLDRGPHIRPIAIAPVSGDETLIGQPFIKLPAMHIPTTA